MFVAHPHTLHHIAVRQRKQILFRTIHGRLLHRYNRKRRIDISYPALLSHSQRKVCHFVKSACKLTVHPLIKLCRAKRFLPHFFHLRLKFCQRERFNVSFLHSNLHSVLLPFCYRAAHFFLTSRAIKKPSASWIPGRSCNIPLLASSFNASGSCSSMLARSKPKDSQIHAAISSFSPDSGYRYCKAAYRPA